MAIFKKWNTFWHKQRDYLRFRNKLVNYNVVKLSQRRQTIILPLIDIKLIILENQMTSKIFLYFYTNAYSILFTFAKINIRKITIYDSDIFKVDFFYKNLKFPKARAHFINYLHIFYCVFMIRLRCRGRLYRVYTRNIYRDLQYRFGRAHIVNVFVEGYYVKYIKKKFFRVFGYDFIQLPLKAYEIKISFPQNIYTRRGVCIGGQIVRTRIGKAVKWY